MMIKDLKYLRKFIKLRSGRIIFDIGANEGQSIERFKSLFPDSIIHSFEPDINLYSILKKNMVMMTVLY